MKIATLSIGVLLIGTAPLANTLLVSALGTSSPTSMRFANQGELLVKYE